jgi:hypothetical protein
MLGGVSHAATVTAVDTLACQHSDGTTIRVPVYAYLFSTSTTVQAMVSLYIPGNQFNAMLSEAYFGSGFSICTLTALNGGSIQNVTVISVDATAAGLNVDVGGFANNAVSQRYTEIVLTYLDFFIGAENAKTLKAPVASAEQQAQNLAAFKLRSANLLKP